MLLDLSDSITTKTVNIKTVKHADGLHLEFKPLSARAFLRFQTNMIDSNNTINDQTVRIMEESVKESCTDPKAWQEFEEEVKPAGFVYLQTVEQLFQMISPQHVN